MTQSIAHAARAVLLTADPAAKVRIARAMARAWRRGLVRHDFDAPMPDMPARPAEPELLPPHQMPKRRRGGPERGRLALLPAPAPTHIVAIAPPFALRGRVGAGLPPGFG